MPADARAEPDAGMGGGDAGVDIGGGSLISRHLIFHGLIHDGQTEKSRRLAVGC